MLFGKLSNVVEIEQMPFSKRIKNVDDTDVTLALYENIVRVEADDANVTVTLPDVGQAAGLAFDVKAVSTNSASNNVILNDATGSAVNTMTADDDYLLVVSNGYEWRTIDSTIT